jgi:hypothetical protein
MHGSSGYELDGALDWNMNGWGVCGSIFCGDGCVLDLRKTRWGGRDGEEKRRAKSREADGGVEQVENDEKGRKTRIRELTGSIMIYIRHTRRRFQYLEER